MSIPTIDLEKATNSASHGEVPEDLKHALLEVGFLYIKNHGVQQSLIDQLTSMLPQLFALSEDVKESVALSNSPHFLGYSKFGSEITAKLQDQREQFEFANELPDAYGLSNGEAALYTRLQGPNQWLSTEHIVGCRSTIEEYIMSMQNLAQRFLALVVEALSLPPESLSSFTGPQDRLKLVHYRPISSCNGMTNGISSQGVGPHKDSSGWMTFLLQASDPSIKGLQVLTKDGTWIDVPSVPGTFVVNMGQAFEIVTNGVCKATTHRVLLPPGDYDRYSVPFFQGVRPELTKSELKVLWELFDRKKWNTRESIEGQLVDSPFLRGNYDTWGEAQLRTKIRSHRDVGQRHYADVFEKYVADE